MAMRDPGTPRRNPLFEHTFDEEGDGVPFVGGPAGTDPFASELDEEDEILRALGAYREPGDEREDAPRDRPSADPLAGLTGVVHALAEAQPEAVEHLVTAAHELVLAVKTVVDAAEAALAAQREALADAPRPADERPSEPRVRRIDLG